LAKRHGTVESLAVMRVLVTGHRGYIGCLLLPKLLQAGYEVFGFDACLYAESAIVGERPPVPERKIDIRDVVAADLHGFDAVVHLAGLSNDPLGDLSPELTDEVNRAATVRLARAAMVAGVPRFLFSSSCSVYGAAGDDFVDETSPCRPVTPYARSKLEAEVELGGLASATFSPVFLRHATAYGVSPHLRFDLALNNLVAWAVSTGRIYVKSDGNAWRPFVHVDDVATAFVAVLALPAAATHTQVLNVGDTAENYQVAQLAQAILDEIPDARIECAPDAGPDQRCYRVDCSKVRRLVPAFAPRWKVIDGIREVAARCREAGWQPVEFEGPRYARVEHLKALLSEGRLEPDLRWAPRSGSHATG
jgi:nucleoside-diphosphate-sugar epimerase